MLSGFARPTAGGRAYDPDIALYAAPTNALTQPPSIPTNFAKRADALPPTASACINTLIIDLQTVVTVPDYTLFYTEPILSFRPTYTPLADGSLVAPPLLDQIWKSNIQLIFVVSLLTLFLRNVAACIKYIRTGHIKNKAHLYTLLVSQMMGPVCFTNMLVPFFMATASCVASNIVSVLCSQLSLSLLLTGVLGMKAYKCLDSSKIVLAILVAFQTATMFFIVAGLLHMDSIKLLTGTCRGTQDSKNESVVFILRFLEAVFISCCFFFALWKSSKFSAFQGRTSIRFSERAVSGQFATRPVTAVEPSSNPRGWWDYVPEAQKSPQPGYGAHHTRFTAEIHISDTLRSVVRSVRHTDQGNSLKREEPGSPSGLTSFKPLPEPPATRESSTPPKPALNRASVFTVSRRLSGLMTRMHLFKEAMRNELAYTAVIAVTNVAAAIMTLVGILGQVVVISPFYLLCINWVVLSLLVVHSFGRVVARNQRDALLQHPASWDTAYRTTRTGSFSLRNRRRKLPSPINTSRSPTWRASSEDIARSPLRSAKHINTDPFDDFEPAKSPIDERSRHTSASSAKPSSLAPSWQSIDDWPAPPLTIPRKGSAWEDSCAVSSSIGSATLASPRQRFSPHPPSPSALTVR